VAVLRHPWLAALVQQTKVTLAARAVVMELHTHQVVAVAVLALLE